MIDLGIEGISHPTHIGVGGFSDVYRATQVGLDRTVAVKVLRGAFDDTTLRRFKREIQTMARVSQHPNVVTVYHAGVSSLEQPYLIMEMIDGGSLGDTLQSGPLGWAEAIDRTLPIANALAFIHRSGILHRDVKPANILVGDGAVKLTDFGICHITDTSLPPTRAMTLQYSAPELFKNGNPDERSDLYSLGATLYALVDGAPPFGGVEQATETAVRRILDEPPPPVSAIPDSLQRFLQRALAKEPDRRWPSADAFATDLAACANDCRSEPQRDRPPRTEPPTLEGPAPIRADQRGDQGARQRSDDPAWDGLAGSASARDRREVARRTANGQILLALAPIPFN